MERTAEHRIPRRQLHTTAHVHHHDAIADVFHQRQVMCYEYQGQIELPLQILKKINDLGLNRDIQCADRFITN